MKSELIISRGYNRTMRDINTHSSTRDITWDDLNYTRQDLLVFVERSQDLPEPVKQLLVHLIMSDVKLAAGLHAHALCFRRCRRQRCHRHLRFVLHPERLRR